MWKLYQSTPPIILDFQQPVSLRLARDIACHIILSGLALFLIWHRSSHVQFGIGAGPIQFCIEAGPIRHTGVALKCATPDSGYPTFLVVRVIKLLSRSSIPFKVTRHLCFKNSKKLQLLDVQACNLANRAVFQNPTKSIYGALGKKAFCQILKRWFIR